MIESEVEASASTGATPGATSILASLVLGLTYPIALLFGEGLATGVVIKLSQTPAIMFGDGEWIEWSIPVLGAAFSALLVGLLVWTLRDRVPTRRARLIVWTWSAVLFVLAGVWAIVAPGPDVMSFATDVPGGFWALIVGGLVGSWLATRRPAARP